MDYVKPEDVAASMLNAGVNKLALAPRDLLIRGVLSGAILGVATPRSPSLAPSRPTSRSSAPSSFRVSASSASFFSRLRTLVTGSFALVPLPWVERRATLGQVLANWGWVMLGNLLGSLAYALLASIVLTNLWTSAPAGVAAKIVSTAEAKTIGYAAIGAAGFITCFVKAMLCNWMVCLAVVLAR